LFDRGADDLRGGKIDLHIAIADKDVPSVRDCRCSTRLPARGRFDVRPIQFRYGRAAKQSNCSLNVTSQDLERSNNARLSRGSQSVGIGPTDENRTRSETDRFDDIATAADPAIHEDFGLTANRSHHFRECPQRRRNGVELPAAVVRNDNRRCTFVHGALGIVARQKTLDDNRA
jgi:hypothetical protein